MQILLICDVGKQGLEYAFCVFHEYCLVWEEFDDYCFFQRVFRTLSNKMILKLYIQFMLTLDYKVMFCYPSSVQGKCVPYAYISLLNSVLLTVFCIRKMW